jgi:hypothetical protein
MTAVRIFIWACAITSFTRGIWTLIKLGSESAKWPYQYDPLKRSTAAQIVFIRLAWFGFAVYCLWVIR